MHGHEIELHCKFQSVKVTQNSHNGHTKIEYSSYMTIVVILYDIHILEFAV